MYHRLQKNVGVNVDFTPPDFGSLPTFEVEYQPDFRQDIANKWPKSIADSEARNDWNWEPKYNLKLMTAVMLEKLEEKYNTIKSK